MVTEPVVDVMRSTSEQSSVPRKVLASALKLFTEFGYFNTTIPEISRSAGVSVGAIYHHFKDKEDIAITLFRNVTNYIDELFTEIEVSFSTARDRCQRIIALLLDIAENQPQTMAYMMYVRHSEIQQVPLTICSSRPFIRMRKIVKDGIDNGEIRAMDPMVATSVIFGPTFRMISHRLDGLLPEALPTYLNELFDAAWRAAKP